MVYWTLHHESLVFGAFMESADLFVYKILPYTYPLKTLLCDIHSQILSGHFYQGTSVSNL
jgi:hypothetical protein